MSDLSPDLDSNDDARDDTGMPLWVKVFGAFFVGLVLVIVILHLTGRGLGGH